MSEKIKVPRFKKELGFTTSIERSRHMGKIKSRNTKPEVQFRKALWSKGYRYRKDYKKLPGRPDVVLKKFNTVIFIDGDFWHGYNWSEKKLKIKSNREFWIKKIERNMQRDVEVTNALQIQGFKVFRFWDWQVKKNLDEILVQVVDHLESVKIE